MFRKKITCSQKVAMVRVMEQRQRDDPSATRRSIAKDLGVDASQLRKWQQKIDVHANKVRTNGTHCNPRACSLHPGRTSCLDPIKDDLVRFIFEQQEQGLLVSIKMVVEVAKSLDASFREKTEAAQGQAVRRFVASKDLVHRVHTYQSQKNAPKMQAEVLAWMKKGTEGKTV
jgi:hypothetical protein